jgi:hypothetical protein
MMYVYFHAVNTLILVERAGVTISGTKFIGATPELDISADAVKVFKRLRISDHKISLKFMDKIMDIIGTF